VKIEIHRSEERGTTELGWLHSRHSFSFGEYFDPKKRGFGVLRVLNEDKVESGMGFGLHPHDNMEIVSIVLSGVLEHKDSEGNHGVIPAGDIQKMSAGSGIRHSEFNHSKEESVHFLQIWIFPKERDIKPGYEQRSFPVGLKKNALLQVISGSKNDKTISIHQDCIFSLGSLDSAARVSHFLNDSTHGVYVFNIEGEIGIEKTVLKAGDAAAITDASKIEFIANKKSEVLVIEVPLKKG